MEHGSKARGWRRREGAAAPHSDTVPQGSEGQGESWRWMWETAQRQDRGAWVRQEYKTGEGRGRHHDFWHRRRGERLPYAGDEEPRLARPLWPLGGASALDQCPVRSRVRFHPACRSESICFQVHLSSGSSPVMLISLMVRPMQVWLKCFEFSSEQPKLTATIPDDL